MTLNSTLRRLTPRSPKSLMISAVIAAFAAASTSARAHEASTNWSADVTGVFATLTPGNVFDNETYAGTFTVPTAYGQTITAHGQLHEYVRTELAGFVFIMSGFPPSEELDSTGSYGSLTVATAKTHQFTAEQLYSFIALGGNRIVSVKAAGNHIFAVVPEPATSGLVLGGLIVAGCVARKRNASRS